MDAETMEINTKALPLTTVRHLNRTLPFDTDTAVRFVREIGLRKEENPPNLAESESNSSPHKLSGEEVRLAYESIVNTNDEQNDSCRFETNEQVTKHRTSTRRVKGRPRNTKPTDRLPSKLDLFKFAQNGDLQKLSMALSSGEYDINLTDQFDWTLLMTAATAGHMTIVQYLLDNNAKWAGLTDKRDMDAVSLAKLNGHHDIANYILQHHTEDTCQEYQIEEPVLIRTSISNGPFMSEGACTSKGACASVDPVYNNTRSKTRSSDDVESSFHCDVCKQAISNSSSSSHSLSICHQFSCHHKSTALPYTLSRANKGFQMMLRSGWDPGQGLGSEGQGRKFPVKTVLKQDRAGIGIQSSQSRVTHFRPGDTSAVLSSRERRRKKDNLYVKNPPTCNKKQREKLIRKERRWEIRMRQYMSSGDN